MNKTQIEIHPIQAGILMELLFHQEARFGQLNSSKVPTDHFNFHLQQLVSQKLIEKTVQGGYTLTREGKEFANRFDTDAAKVERQAKIGVLIIAHRGRGRLEEFLMQERLKQPYYGYIGFVTGKVRWGEPILTAAAREFKEETGLTAKLTFRGLTHKRDYDQADNLLEDKIFLVILAEKIRGKLIENFEGGRNFWCPRSAVKRQTKLFSDIELELKQVTSSRVNLVEFPCQVREY